MPKLIKCEIACFSSKITIFRFSAAAFKHSPFRASSPVRQRRAQARTSRAGAVALKSCTRFFVLTVLFVLGACYGRELLYGVLQIKKILKSDKISQSYSTKRDGKFTVFFRSIRAILKAVHGLFKSHLVERVPGTPHRSLIAIKTRLTLIFKMMLKENSSEVGKSTSELSNHTSKIQLHHTSRLLIFTFEAVT